MLDLVMCSRRYKGMVQNSVILVLIICIGYGFYMYTLLQERIKLTENRYLRQHEALSSQMQVVYEDKATLEKTLKKTKAQCEEEKDQKEELIQGMLVEHQDKYQAMITANQKLEDEKSELSKEFKILQLRYDNVNQKHEDLKTKHKESLESFSKDVNMAHEDLQKCKMQQETFEQERGSFAQEKASFEERLQTLHGHYENVLKTLKTIPRDAVNFNHPALKDTSDSSKNYIYGLLGESQAKLMQLPKENKQQPQGIVPQPIKDDAVQNAPQREETIHHDSQELHQNSPKEVAESVQGVVPVEQKDPEIVPKNVDEVDRSHEPYEKAHVQQEDGQNFEIDAQAIPDDNIHPPALVQHDGGDQMQGENPKDSEQLENVNNAQPDVVKGPGLDEDHLNVGNELHDIPQDDPANDLGGPIGDNVVDDLGAKEVEDGDGLHDVNDVKPATELYVDGEEKHFDNAADIDAPAENDDLQIEDDESDIHKAMAHDEEDMGGKENVQQVGLPPAARVSDEELEVAVNAPPALGKKEAPVGGEMLNRKGVEDYRGDAYEQDEYDKDGMNGENNHDDQGKSQDYSREEEGDEERENRKNRNSRRERLDRNFEVMKQVDQRVRHAENL